MPLEDLKSIGTAPRDGREVLVLHGRNQREAWATWNRAVMAWQEVGTDKTLHRVFYWIGEPRGDRP
jgi:hypothetical protein